MEFWNITWVVGGLAVIGIIALLVWLINTTQGSEDI